MWKVSKKELKYINNDYQPDCSFYYESWVCNERYLIVKINHTEPAKIIWKRVINNAILISSAIKTWIKSLMLHETDMNTLQFMKKMTRIKKINCWNRVYYLIKLTCPMCDMLSKVIGLVNNICQVYVPFGAIWPFVVKEPSQPISISLDKKVSSPHRL